MRDQNIICCEATYIQKVTKRMKSVHVDRDLAWYSILLDEEIHRIFMIIGNKLMPLQTILYW